MIGWITGICDPTYHDRNSFRAELKSLVGVYEDEDCGCLKKKKDSNGIRRIHEKLAQGRIIRNMRRFNKKFTRANKKFFP